MITAADMTQTNNSGDDDGNVDVDFGTRGGFNEDPLNDSEGEEGGQGEEDPANPSERAIAPLRSIFDCEYIVACVVNNGKDGWKCWWCNKIFSLIHAMRALSHVLKIQKNGIEICKAVIPEINKKKYSDLYQVNMEQKMSKKHSSNFIEDSVEMLQNSSVKNLLHKCSNLGAVSVQQSSFVSASSTPVGCPLFFRGGKHKQHVIHLSEGMSTISICSFVTVDHVNNEHGHLEVQ